MSNKNNRPQNMSQLDYLWVNFGSYEVSDSMDATGSIPTTEAVKEYIDKSDTGIVKLDTQELVNTLKIRIFGVDKKGAEITSIEIDQDTKIISFVRRPITQEDIDNGVEAELGEDYLVLETNKGDKFFVSINNLNLTGQTTNTVITLVVNNKVASSVRINNPITDRSVDITATDSGLRADLILNPDSKSKVLLLKSDKGVETKFVWEGTEKPVGFLFLTFADYQLMTPEEGTIYFITDEPSIWFNGIKFSSVGPYVTLDDMKNALNEIKQDVLTLVDDINKSLSNKVDWTNIANLSNPNRKAIVLKNHDTLLGTDTKGSTYNIAMISKWDVVDLGTGSLPINLNTPKDVRPTVQEAGSLNTEDIAYLSDFNWIDVE